MFVKCVGVVVSLSAMVCVFPVCCCLSTMMVCSVCRCCSEFVSDGVCVCLSCVLLSVNDDDVYCMSLLF